MRVNATLAAIASSALLLAATSAAAGPLSESCTELAESSAAGCKLETPKGGPWTLTTNLLVGGGTKERIEALEEQFCATVQGLGIQGHVVRWSQVAGLSNGAKMEWSCAPTAVSAAPSY